MKILIFSACISLLSFSALADNESFTVQKLKTICEGNDPVFNYQSCYGYINGVGQGAALTNKIGNLPQIFCPPANVTNGQTADVFLKWARENPKFYQTTAAAGVIASLTETFPCPNPPNH